MIEFSFCSVRGVKYEGKTNIFVTAIFLTKIALIELFIQCFDFLLIWIFDPYLLCSWLWSELLEFENFVKYLILSLVVHTDEYTVDKFMGRQVQFQ